jgi:hypothetical protein
MDWDAVIQSLTETMHGAELVAKTTDDPHQQLEAKIVSGVAASLASALQEGLERYELRTTPTQENK